VYPGLQQAISLDDLARAVDVVTTSGLTVLQVAGFPLLRHWSVVWRKDIPLSAAARAFVDYLQRAALQ
jgi:DNA-binding transcriptional LysR family regulator